MNIGIRIKELRKNKGLRQKELADDLGVTAQAISMWESGLRDPNANQRQKLCKFFKISEAELFGAPKTDVSPEILEALQDPVAVKALLVTHKNSDDIKMAIRHMLDCFPGLSPDKRQAILALCK